MKRPEPQPSLAEEIRQWDELLGAARTFESEGPGPDDNARDAWPFAGLTSEAETSPVTPERPCR